MADDGHKNKKASLTGSPSHIAPSFNAAATEIEIKFLLNHNDLNIFKNIRDYFREKNWVRFEQENSQLLTRQLDTKDMDLYKKGHTIRLRGSCLDNDLSKVHTPDVCIKTGKTADESGALHRGEFEARIKSFNHVMLSTLKEKYPRAENPQLYAILDDLHPRDLREYFRIDCMRSRYLIEIPEEETKLYGKRVIAEVELDDNVYVLDLPGIEKPLIFHADMEVEAEIKFKPCEYTESQVTVPVSSPLTKQETVQAMLAMKRHILKGAGSDDADKPNLRANDMSKAERGFENLFGVLDKIQNFLNKFMGPEQIEINHQGVRIKNVCDLETNYFTSFRDLCLALLPDRDFSDVARRRNVASDKSPAATSHTTTHGKRDTAAPAVQPT